MQKILYSYVCAVNILSVSLHVVYISSKQKENYVVLSILYLSWIILPLKRSTHLSYHLLHAFLILCRPTRHSLRLRAHFMLYQLVLGICPYDFRKIPQYLWYFVVTAVIVFFFIIWCIASGNPNIQAPFLFLQSF